MAGRPATLKFTPVAEVPGGCPPSADLCRDGLLTVAEACKLLRRGRTKLYQLMDCGDLQYVQDADGCHRFVPRVVLEAFVAKRLRTGRTSQ